MSPRPSRTGPRGATVAPGERFEWIEAEPARPKAPKLREGARAQAAQRCRRCGWVDSLDEVECFRCGEPFPREEAATPAICPGLPPPEPSLRVALQPARQLFEDRGPNAEPALWRLRRRSAEHARLPGFERLLALAQVNSEHFQRYAHQQRVARRVLEDMGGAALLADETGLGKTIEAGLVAKELLLRGLAQRVLVVVPASLGLQWREEMAEKFNLEFVFARDPADLADDPPLVIVSYAGLRGPGLGKVLRERGTDLLVCDEAHHLRNRSTKQYKAVARVRKTYVLLLSATPFHNRLVELKNLLDILKPGLLGSTRAFNRQYVDERDPRKPRNLHHLQQLLGEVMIRNRREDVAVKLPARRAAIYHLELAAAERSFYDELSAFISDEVRSGALTVVGPTGRGHSFALTLISLQRQLCSSPAAVAQGLRTLAATEGLPPDLVARAQEFERRALALGEWRKAQAIEEVLARFPGKVIVFCEFRATIRALVERLRAAGIATEAFHGGLSPGERAAAIARFRDQARVLVSSKAGAEGLNVQFCSTVVNFDLPWNPMVVEQRIGRVHRLGQTRDVTVFNLSVKGTIEARVLELLARKLRLFTAVLGEVDLILGSLHAERSFEELLRDVWLQGTRAGDVDAALEAFGRKLEEARAAYDAIKEAEAVLDVLAPAPEEPSA
ncbi:MAG: DEAD/DEAH box helicase [Planctomycetota bacterium]|nr:MAG: DEAD/DEAH box helicase [Planctomycetota bacterium]